MRRAGRILVLGTGLGLAACTQFPELDAAVDPAVYDQDFPRLQPLDQLLTSPERRVSPAIEGQIKDRVARLRARAGRLAGPVVDAATKRRMARGVPR